MSRSNKKVVPEAQNALDKMKFEIASELNIPLKNSDNGDLTARQAGQIGGNITRRLIKMAEEQLNK